MLLINKIVIQLCAQKRLWCKSVRIVSNSFSTSSQCAAKLYVDNESAHFYNVLPSLLKPTGVSLNACDLEFEQELEQLEWRKVSMRRILKAFCQLPHYCKTHNLTIADNRFDTLIDGFLDNCEYLSDNQIEQMLEILKSLPLTNSVTSRNFVDLWQCLDDLCCWKMTQWSTEQQMRIAERWYLLYLGKLTDYTYEIFTRLGRHVLSTSQSNLLRFYFYLSIFKTWPIEYEAQHSMLNYINNLTVDEMGLVALAHTKTESVVKMPDIMHLMAYKVIENKKTVNEITLAAILKAIRRNSCYGKMHLPILELLDELTDEIPRFSLKAAVQIALLPIDVFYFHEASLVKCCKRLLDEIHSGNTVRLKDIERFLLVTTLFDYTPHSNFLQICVKELCKDDVLTHFQKYPVAILCALHYLTANGIYIDNLLSHALDINRIRAIYPTPYPTIPSELLKLDVNIEIEATNYCGNRLPIEWRHKLVKFHVEDIQTPSRLTHKSLSFMHRIIVDIIRHLEELIGVENCHHNILLPHFNFQDIVLCKDKTSGRFIEPFGFEKYVLGDVKYVPSNDPNLEWHVLMTLIPKHVIINTEEAIGLQKMRKRQLERLGYKTHFVLWNDFLYTNAEEKKAVLRRLLDKM